MATIARHATADDPRWRAVSALNGMCAAQAAGWLNDIRAAAPACEALRPLTHKPKSTGTISEAACLYLRCLVERIRPRVVVEIGTFIGTSALVLASTGATVYTCDKDNAAFPGTDQIICYPKTGSTAMLTDLVAKRVQADLFFVDGRIQPEDLALIAQLSGTRTVYAFDDYEGREKGVINVEAMRPIARDYQLRTPPVDVFGLPSATTIAVLEPKGALL